MATQNKIVDYANWGEYRAALDKLPYGDRGFDATSGADGLSFGEARKIADTGWAEGAARVQSITLPVVNAMSGSLEHDDLGFDVTGGAFDVGAYMMGIPECWLTLNARDVRPAITIAANVTSSGGIPARSLEMRGAAVAALALALQSSGYAVRVHAIVGMAVQDSARDTIWQRVCLTDDMGGPIDTDRLMFALAHPSAIRQLMYGNGVREQGYSTHTTYWLPWPEGGPKARPPEQWKADLYLHAVYLDDAAWADEASVTAWVAEQYATLTRGGDAQE